ncbi:Plasmid stabilization system protein ParE [Fodinibius roseus]|uniref:Plasmid stabilization system protein ParE n=1 Tax=Fodinibius roseus TaxID=1194090 RepID=A0A1M5E2G5_9BACT|nr:type II toxin-antitoxin system RelE/ParE family toxin [Fodinibius roseus]SHF73427.1 Plasmid stabilization system protein ParE [Fodinibius roseus]
MRIIWTEKAEKQLNQIFEYIASDSSLYAHRTVGQIIEEVESILSHPRKGRMVPEYERDNIREVFHHPYRIIYLLKDETIEILSVIHGARLLPDDLK